MDDLLELGQRIDAAHDARDKTALCSLIQECQNRLEIATDKQRVFLLYYVANIHAGIYNVNATDTAHAWGWNLPETIDEILALRQAIQEPAFDEIDDTFQCRMRTNLGNRLNNLGRPIAAIEQWDTVLRQNQRFAMALGNRAFGVTYYGRCLYDQGHGVIMLDIARAGYNAALSETAEWDAVEHSHSLPVFEAERNQIVAYLKAVEFDHHYNLDQWPLGDSDQELHYRRWCLDKKLFLNPLNDVLNLSVAATDVLHLPSHSYRIDEVPRFVGYYNLLKQEYMSSRYHLYSAMNEAANCFLNRDVLLFDIEDGSVHGYHTEELKAAFRSAYAIFDKIGLFLNDYYTIGLKPREVNFRNVWSEKTKGAKEHRLRPIFHGKENWSLRGLYFLSKDLFDEEFNDAAEPDAARLSDLRNRTEHRFLSLQQSGYDMSSGTDTHSLISLTSFQENALRMLRMAREALIYLSLAMHQEERIRNKKDADKDKIIPSFKCRQIGVDELF